MRNKYDIVIATDTNYIIHALTLMASVGTNEKDETCFSILSFNLTDEDKKKFEIIPLKFPQVSYYFYDLSESSLKERIFSNIEVSKDRSYAAYARLLIPEILPIEIRRCIYMDVDGIVCNSLADYYHFEFGDSLIAGVRDTNPIFRHRNIGLNCEDVYVNSGMIVWNLDMCRKGKVVGRFRRFIKEHNGNIDAMDQGVINGTLCKQTMVLPPRFNVLTTFFQMNSQELLALYKAHTYRDNEILEARVNPLFVHFTPNLTTRPWEKHCMHPLADEYWKYRRMVSASGGLIDDTRNIKMRFLSCLFNYNHSLYFSFMKLVK